MEEGRPPSVLVVGEGQVVTRRRMASTIRPTPRQELSRVLTAWSAGDSGAPRSARRAKPRAARRRGPGMADRTDIGRRSGAGNLTVCGLPRCLRLDPHRDRSPDLFLGVKGLLKDREPRERDVPRRRGRGTTKPYGDRNLHGQPRRKPRRLLRVRSGRPVGVDWLQDSLKQVHRNRKKCRGVPLRRDLAHRL